ncbi:hypothetical protein E2L92_21990 [Salmonella enterica subsp. enterica serovar Ibadan]|nr:hypothetical protein [Salmonella enterica subsp. enterica serovar Ibadan]ECF3282124.1 hypothetical protein [Salmonella enterica subsp. enterica serovar Ibadan]
MANDKQTQLDDWEKDSNHFVTVITKLASSMKGGEQDVIKHILWTAERWLCDGTKEVLPEGEITLKALDSGGNDTIYKVVDCFAEMVQQGKIIKVLETLLPIEIYVDDNGKVIKPGQKDVDNHSGTKTSLADLKKAGQRADRLVKIDSALRGIQSNNIKTFTDLYRELGLIKARKPKDDSKDPYSFSDAQSKIYKTITTAIKKAVDESDLDEIEVLKDLKTALTKELNNRIKKLEKVNEELDQAKTPAPATA